MPDRLAQLSDCPLSGGIHACSAGCGVHYAYSAPCLSSYPTLTSLLRRLEVLLEPQTRGL